MIGEWSLEKGSGCNSARGYLPQSGNAVSEAATFVTKGHRSAGVFDVNVEGAVGLFDPLRRKHAAVGAVHFIASFLSPDVPIFNSVHSLNQPEVPKIADSSVHRDAIRVHAV